jgi:hypothetical protein
MSIRFYLAQSLVTDAEMMRDLVAKHVLDQRAYLLDCAASQFNWVLINADLVRQDKPVVMGAFCLWDAMIKTKKLRLVAYPGYLHRLPVRPALDDDLDVVEFLPESLWQVVQSLGHEKLKSAAVHSERIIPSTAQFCRSS